MLQKEALIVKFEKCLDEAKKSQSMTMIAASLFLLAEGVMSNPIRKREDL